MVCMPQAVKSKAKMGSKKKTLRIKKLPRIKIPVHEVHEDHEEKKVVFVFLSVLSGSKNSG